MLIITVLVLLVASVVLQETILLYMSGLMALRLLSLTIATVLFAIIVLAYSLVNNSSE